MNEAAVFDLIKMHIKRAGSQSALAAEIGISGAYLSDVLNGNRPLSDQLLEKLGLVRITTYRRRDK